MDTRQSEFDAERATEELYLRNIAALSETKLIIRALKWFVLPWFMVGVLSCLFPYVYAFVPVHMSEICICNFFAKAADGDKNYIVMETLLSYSVLSGISMVSFYTTNFVLALILIYMVYKIRMIHDDT